ncbi:MAG: hypothetical protein ACKOAR_08070, partial [Bacteroidota bacterium]
MQITVMIAESNRFVTIPVREVDHFKLRYARPKHYGWTIPLGILLPLMNGFYALFTLPIHLVVT